MNGQRWLFVLGACCLGLGVVGLGGGIDDRGDLLLAAGYMLMGVAVGAISFGSTTPDVPRYGPRPHGTFYAVFDQKGGVLRLTPSEGPHGVTCRLTSTPVEITAHEIWPDSFGSTPPDSAPPTGASPEQKGGKPNA